MPLLLLLLPVLLAPLGLLLLLRLLGPVVSPTPTSCCSCTAAAKPCSCCQRFLRDCTVLVDVLLLCCFLSSLLNRLFVHWAIYVLLQLSCCHERCLA
jgi:hypothetical protein